MSVLTKLFVVLLVVLSLLLAAATITFVNTIGYDRQANAAAVAAAQNEATSKAELLNRSTAEVATLGDRIKMLEDQLAQSQQSVRTGETALANSAAQLAKAEAAAQLANADISRLTAALSAIQQTQGVQQTQLAALRTEFDTIQTQNGELNVALADARNRLEVTETARRIGDEQVQELRTQNDRLNGILRGRGIPTDAAPGASAAPPINGVVRDVRPIAGVPFATISVGSDDAVRQGMEFRVLDRANGKFLGVLTVTNVEPNEAVGRLTGPAVQAIRAGNEVRTQM